MQGIAHAIEGKTPWIENATPKSSNNPKSRLNSCLYPSCASKTSSLASILDMLTKFKGGLKEEIASGHYLK